MNFKVYTISALGKILNQAQIHLCLCVSLFWCFNTLIFWRVCSSETSVDCRHSWKANNVTCVRIFLLLPVNSMSVVLAYDVELRPYVHTHSKHITLDYLPFQKYFDFCGMWGFYVMDTYNVRILNPPCASAALWAFLCDVGGFWNVLSDESPSTREWYF